MAQKGRRVLGECRGAEPRTFVRSERLLHLVRSRQASDTYKRSRGLLCPSAQCSSCRLRRCSIGFAEGGAAWARRSSRGGRRALPLQLRSIPHSLVLEATFNRGDNCHVVCSAEPRCAEHAESLSLRRGRAQTRQERPSGRAGGARGSIDCTLQMDAAAALLTLLSSAQVAGSDGGQGAESGRPAECCVADQGQGGLRDGAVRIWLNCILAGEARGGISDAPLAHLPAGALTTKISRHWSSA